MFFPSVCMATRLQIGSPSNSANVVLTSLIFPWSSLS